MRHTVIPPPRGTTATLELTHKGNINDKTISERDREVRDLNVTLLASAITSRRHLVIDTHRTNLGVTNFYKKGVPGNRKISLGVQKCTT